MEIRGPHSWDREEGARRRLRRYPRKQPMRHLWLLVTVCAVAILAGVACGGKNAPSSTQANRTPPAPAAAKPVAAGAPAAASSAAAPGPAGDTAPPDMTALKFTGDLDGMIERRLIRVLTTYSKIHYFVDQGTPRGLVYDSFKLFERDLNVKLKSRKAPQVIVVIIPVAHDELVPALLAGRGDVVAAGTLLTGWRAEQVAFSTPMRTQVSTLVVSAPGSTPAKSVADFGGREYYLRMSDVSKQGLDRFAEMLKKAGKPPFTIIPAPETLSDEDILEMVNAGLVDATICDEYLADFWHQVFPDLVLHKAAPVRTGMSTGMLVRQDNPLLLAEINAFIARYPPGSLTRNLLLQEYLKSLKHARNATSSAERRKFEQTIELFRKYGDQYDIDFLLMAAQGYQESKLDHQARSAVGAIGIMQVMPATGKELAVGDIRQLEPNVNAGIKYVRQMIDRNYAKEPMDDLNKVLFSFAAYNAGPARVAQLRKRAAVRGLNPNVWFNNVEIMTAEVVGQETVQYVSNVYKYYLAYKLLYEQGRRREQDKARTVPSRASGASPQGAPPDHL